MAFNSGFPATYQPMYFQQYQPGAQVPQQSGQVTGIIWVQGEAAAKSYLVAPNTTVQLWDSEKQVIYLKSADASGMPSMKVLDYTIRDQMPTNGPVNAATNQAMDLSIYVTKAEFEALKAEIGALTKKGGAKDE